MKKHQDLIISIALRVAKNAKQKHAAALKDLIISDDFRKIILTMKDKLKEPIKKLQEATFALIDFLNTPYDVLFAEVEADTERNSGLELQWQSMQNALIQCLTDIQAIKKNTKTKERLLALQKCNRTKPS